MWYKSFYPSKKKIIFAAIITFIFYFILFFVSRPLCERCPPLQCPNEWPNMIHNCDCCVTFSDFLAQLLIVIILPFVISYLAYSIFSLIISHRK